VAKRYILVVLLWAGLAASAIPGQAQSALMNLPRQSQHAVLTQRIGITDITVVYSRPLVNGRKVWGGLVPYGQVWRAGANENTTIRFADAVTIDGHALPAGTYGLHMIPNENDWTVIFSKAYTSWGSFTYNQAEDALRVTVKPQATDMHEALTYDFDEVKPNGAVLTLRWEKLAVPVPISVNTHEIVAENLRGQLRGLPQYTWDGWDDSANYLLAEKYDYEDALKYADRSIQVEERYENLMTKSQVLDALGKKDDAEAAKKMALAKANAIQLHLYARGLQAAGKQAEAFEVFKENAKKNPDSWIVHVGLCRMYSAQGNFPEATKELKIAMNTAPDPQKPQLEGFAKRLDDKQDINK
jgi:tetratricopeptide (TPR) repeat protein